MKNISFVLWMLLAPIGRSVNIHVFKSISTQKLDGSTLLSYWCLWLFFYFAVGCAVYVCEDK